MCWVHEEGRQDEGSICEKENVSVDQLARKIFLAAVRWMPLEQLVGQINGAFNSGTSCRMSACCCSLPGEVDLILYTTLLQSFFYVTM